MARPRIIHDERKEVRGYVGMRVWEKLSKEAHGKGSSMSAVIRELLEEKYGQG